MRRICEDCPRWRVVEQEAAAARRRWPRYVAALKAAGEAMRAELGRRVEPNEDHTRLSCVRQWREALASPPDAYAEDAEQRRAAKRQKL